MKLWIEQGLKEEDIKSFLESSLQNIMTFIDKHTVIIEDFGVYIKKDNYVLCFCAPRGKETELFIVPFTGKINDKETFKELIDSSFPKPFEYKWEEINQNFTYSKNKEQE